MARKINSILDLQFDEHNANKGTSRGRQLLEQSLSKLGAGRSIVCDKNGVVIGGNKTLETAQKLRLELQVIHTQGDKLVAVIRDDLDFKTDPRARELALADNRIAELDLDWNLEQLLQDLSQTSLELWNPAELQRLQDNVDLAEFEQLANADPDEIVIADEAEKTSGNKPDTVPFHCLLTYQQREQLFKAVNGAKGQYGLQTTAEALVAIAEEYLNE